MGSSTIPDSGGGKQPYAEKFYTSGTWTKPAGVTTATVTCIGGGGGSYYATNTFGGGGGGGYIKTTLDVSALSSVTVTVGAGGVSSDTAASVTDGSLSSFGSSVFAYGGQGRTNAWSGRVLAGGSVVAQDSGYSEDTTDTGDGITQGKFAIVNTSLSTAANQWQDSTAAKYGTQQTVAYNGTNLYVATAQVNNEIWTSSNGITWTKNTTTTGTNVNVGWNGTYFVMVPNATGTTAYYGTNGTSWTTSALPTSQTWSGVISITALSVAYSAGSTSAAYSTNGTTWTGVTLPAAIAGNVSMSVANGRIYYTTVAGAAYYTTNGSTWNAAGTVGSDYVFTYNASSATYLAHSYTGYGGTGTYYTSTNGTTWTSRAYTTQLPKPAWFSGSSYGVFMPPVVIDDRWFMFASRSGVTTYSTSAVMLSSTDGINWTILRTWSKGVNVGTATTQYATFMNAIFSAGTNRWLVYFLDQCNTITNVCAAYMSRYMQGGQLGQMAANYSSAIPYANNIAGSAGAGSSKGQAVQVWNAGTQPVEVNYLGGEGIGGYCRGGDGMLVSLSIQQNQNVGSVNYGDGAPTYQGAPNGGNGLVIVEWWA